MFDKLAYRNTKTEPTRFVLNSAKHEIFSGNKYEYANNSWRFHIY